MERKIICLYTYRCILKQTRPNNNKHVNTTNKIQLSDDNGRNVLALCTNETQINATVLCLTGSNIKMSYNIDYFIAKFNI